MKAKTFRAYSWSDYGLSCWRVKELEAFCRQYPERVRSPAAAARLDCRMIEEAARQTAKAADFDGLFREILRNVTEGTGHAKLDAPFSAADFYGLRRFFFHCLDELQEAAKAASGEGDETGTRRGGNGTGGNDAAAGSRQQGRQRSWPPMELGCQGEPLPAERWD